MNKQIVTSLAVVAGAQILKFAVVKALSKVAERKAKDERLKEMHANFDAAKPKN